MEPYFTFQSIKQQVFRISIIQGAQYIGEICRYLLSAPETPEEKEHSIEIMFGNGNILGCYRDYEIEM